MLNIESDIDGGVEKILEIIKSFFNNYDSLDI